MGKYVGCRWKKRVRIQFGRMFVYGRWVRRQEFIIGRLDDSGSVIRGGI